METVEREVIVTGSGPAGYTAAIYLARAGLNPIVFEGSELGGALMTTSDVENYPGFEVPILGPDLMARMRKQALAVGAELIPMDATAMNLLGSRKTVRTAAGCYSASSIILAMGSQTRMLGLDSENWALGNGMSTCATCDGFFFKNRAVTVVGGGDSALEEAVFLSKLASKVTLIHRTSELRGSVILAERARAAGVVFRMNETVVEILGGDSVQGIRTASTTDGTETELETDGLFVAIGQDPRTSLIHDQIEVSESGHVKVDSPHSTTNIPGVFACGDLVDPHYRQAVTAAGSGCVAALDAQRWISQEASALV